MLCSLCLELHPLTLALGAPGSSRINPTPAEPLESCFPQHSPHLCRALPSGTGCHSRLFSVLFGCLSSSSSGRSGELMTSEGPISCKVYLLLTDSSVDPFQELQVGFLDVLLCQTQDLFCCQYPEGLNHRMCLSCSASPPALTGMWGVKWTLYSLGRRKGTLF